jgi:hypothetical protein
MVRPKSKLPTVPAAEPLWLVLRYAGAIVVAFLVSSFIMLVGAGLLVGIIPFLAGAPPETSLAAFAVAYVASLAGVFLGSLCLRGRDRRLASVALMILGLGYYLARSHSLRRELSFEYNGRVSDHPLLWPLAVGALSAVLATILTSRKPRTANPPLERPPDSASVSKSDVSGPAPRN